MNHLEQNPPWVNRILTDNWQHVVKAAPAEYLPAMNVRGSKRTVATEYGCGHYGCVMAPVDPATNVVVKVTSDPSEAAFILEAWDRIEKPPPFGASREDWLENLDVWPSGIVRYYQILELEGTHRKRPTWVLWRDEAWDVGGIYDACHTQDKYERRELSQGVWRLQQFQVHAKYVREKLLKKPEWRKKAAQLWKEHRFYDDSSELIIEEKRQYGNVLPSFGRIAYLRGAERVAAHLEACQSAAQMMASEPAFTQVGAAFEQFLDVGLLLADVHTGNIGRALPGEQRSLLQGWVITDPGHVVVLW